MHQALKIALARQHHDKAARAYANLCGITENRLQFADTERFLAEGIAYCDEHNITTCATFMRSAQAFVYERTGRWDEAVALAEQILSEARPSPLNRQRALVRLGVILARRGVPGYWPYLNEAATTADEQGQPPLQVAARLAQAEAHWLDGRTAQARHAGCRLLRSRSSRPRTSARCCPQRSRSRRWRRWSR